MIRLATVFSGIGAIEHALDRMDIDHTIIFACDNGDVDILSPRINSNVDEIETEIYALAQLIEELNGTFDDIYKNQLFNMFDELRKEYKKTYEQLVNIQMSFLNIDDILLKIINMKNLKQNKKKEYQKLKLNLLNGSAQQVLLVRLKLILKITNDFKKDNSLDALGTNDDLVSFDGIEWNFISQDLKKLYDSFEKIGGKKIIRSIQDVSQRICQLHEKINYLKIQEHLSTFGNDWGKRKKYVDELYKGLEKRNKVKISYMANYQISEEDYHWNAAFLDGRQYRNQVDLFVGGSPCQSFSSVGKQRGLEDTRGTLFYEYARLIKEVNPKIFIYENVKAVISHDKGKTWKKMKEVFSDLGYEYYYDILNAKNYGIPQNRERLFVVGFRADVVPKKGFSFPNPIELKHTMKDYLIDNAPGGYFLPEKGVDFVTQKKNLDKKFTQIDGNVQLCQKKNQQFNWHGDFVFQSEEDAKRKKIPDFEKYFLSEKVKKYVLASGTKSFYSKPSTDLDIARPLLTTMHKMHRAGIDNYVTTDGRLRKLTPRECLRLMGFSDSFKIVVSDTSMYQQAGNSIVVDVLIAILKKINIERYGE